MTRLGGLEIKLLWPLHVEEGVLKASDKTALEGVRMSRNTARAEARGWLC